MHDTKSICGNPLLLEFLKEMMEKEAAKGTNANKGYFVLKKAYESMSICPLPFSHPSEAVCLKGIGPNICQRLEKRLELHCKENGLDMPLHPSQAIEHEEGDQLQSSEPQDKRKPRSAKAYVPAKRSGPYALLRALGSLPRDQTINKAELIRLASPFSDTSFDIPKDGKYYTAWNGMKILEQKNLVYKNGSPARYCLTDEGIDICRKIEEAEARINELNQSRPVVSSSTTQSISNAYRPKGGSKRNRKTDEVVMEDLCNLLQERRSLGDNIHSHNLTGTANGLSGTIQACRNTTGPTSMTGCLTSRHGFTTADPAVMEALSLSQPSLQRATPLICSNTSSQVSQSASCVPAGRYTIQIVIDVREVRSEREKRLFTEKLEQSGIDVVVRALEVGDVLWIAKDSLDGQEYILDYVVERKRMDDLASSIKDGRFHEQKFRLTRSGAKQIIYVIEETGMDKSSYFREAIETAISSSQVQSGFFVKRVLNLEGTVTYLCRLSKQIKELYSTEPLYVLPSLLVSSQNYHNLRSDLRRDEPQRRYTISYSDFAQMTSKTGALTLADVFLKMLMTIRGVSAEKAIEIQRVFPTPRHLLDSYNNCRDEMERKTLISNSIQGYGRKKIGNSLSEKIYEIWGK